MPESEAKLTNAEDDAVQLVRDVANRKKCLRLSRTDDALFPKTLVNAVSLLL